jgi:hypothetical protein
MGLSMPSFGALFERAGSRCGCARNGALLPKHIVTPDGWKAVQKETLRRKMGRIQAEFQGIGSGTRGSPVQ